MSLLAWALCVVFGAAGFTVGALRYDRYGKAQWIDGYTTALTNNGVGLAVALAEAEACAEPYDRALNEWEAFDEVPDYEQADAVRDVPPAAGRELGDDGGGEGAPGVLAGGPPHPRQLDPPRPVDSSDPGITARGVQAPGGPGRGYGPYLAAIGRDDPAGWYANLTADPPPPEPGPEPEPAFVERVLLHEALEWRKVDAWHARFMDAFHADVSAWDRFAARWAEAARFELVGSRSWPPPELAGVA